MYLTRMQLDVRKRDTIRALSNPNIIHGAVEDAFPGERKRRLWRIDCLKGNYFLLIVSEDKPDLVKAVEQFGVSDSQEPWETKDYNLLLNRLQAGDCWHFRLMANPTISHMYEGKVDDQEIANKNTRGKVYAHITTENQKSWLMQRATDHGFILKDEDFNVVNQEWYIFNKSSRNKLRVSILSVTYEGVLNITDTEHFCRTLCNGIGRAKAYGMGMLTVADCFRENKGEENE